ncbi:unnamed protein product [Rotaria sp. Silwood2]|nr:unnamed protein product [Rotaria sp. Silwood2]
MEKNASNETDFTSVELLKHITQETYRIGLTIIFVLGVIGHLFNLRLFTRPTMIKSSCCQYFLASSYVCLIRLFLGVFVRMLYLGYQVNTGDSTIEWWCKIRVAIVYTLYLVSSALNTVASLDRYASSCRQSRYRRFCEPIVAHRMIAIVIVAACIINSHMLFNVVIVNGDCWTKPGWYRIAYDIFFLVVYSFCCPLLSGIFGLLTIKNLRQCHLPRLYQAKMKDFQVMTFAHTICFILLTTPFAVHKLYWAVIGHHPVSSMQGQWEGLSMCIVRVVWFTNDGAGFYIYSLSSARFRVSLLISVGKQKSSYANKPCIWQLTHSSHTKECLLNKSRNISNLYSVPYDFVRESINQLFISVDKYVLQLHRLIQSTSCESVDLNVLFQKIRKSNNQWRSLQLERAKQILQNINNEEFTEDELLQKYYTHIIETLTPKPDTASSNCIAQLREQPFDLNHAYEQAENKGKECLAQMLEKYRARLKLDLELI